MHRSALLRLAVVLLASCSPGAAGEVTPDAAAEMPDSGDDQFVPDFCNATDPRAIPVEVVVTPEAGEAPYVTALQSATYSIEVQIYLMGYGGILDTLKAKAAAGVTVRVMLDQLRKDVNQKYYDQLTAAGAQVKWSSPQFSYQHSKFLLIDRKLSVISTGNFSKNGSILIERNHVAVNHDKADAIDLANLFYADWFGDTASLPCTRLVVSPINARTRILDLINSAQSTLLIESMQFADDQVRLAVKNRKEAGVDVRVLLASPGWIDANADAAAFLQSINVPAKWLGHPDNHTKVIVADGQRAYLGSENLSWTSLNKNREVGLVVTDAVSITPIMTTFETDWTAGTSF